MYVRLCVCVSADILKKEREPEGERERRVVSLRPQRQIVSNTVVQ